MRGANEYPLYGEIEERLVAFLAAHGPVKPEETYAPLAEEFRLTAEQRSRPCATRDESFWGRRVRFARQNLVMRGIVGRKPRGVWQLAEQGSADRPF